MMAGKGIDENKSEREKPENEKVWPIERILKRISAIVIVLGAIAGGIATIVVQIDDITEALGLTGKSEPVPETVTKPSGRKTDDATAPQGPAQCFTAKLLRPNLLPHYLLPSMGGSEHFPYWLKFVGKNNCNKKLLFTVRFEPKTGVVFNPQWAPLSIEPHESFKKVVAPDNVQLASLDIPYVKILYSIEDETKKIIDKGIIETQIVPPYTIAWDLQKPQTPAGQVEPVDRQFLVASLAAWVIRPPKIVADRARECRTPPSGGHQLIEQEALRSCYDNLFWGDPAVQIRVHDAPIKLPDGKRQKIEQLSVTLQEKSATSLEAALLFAAVMSKERVHGIDPDLIMLAAPEKNDSMNKTVYIVWQGASDSWKAIDLRKANQKAFDDNLTEASGRVNSAFASEIDSAIAAGGALFSPDARIVVLHFRMAQHEYGIWSLPKD